MAIDPIMKHGMNDHSAVKQNYICKFLAISRYCTVKIKAGDLRGSGIKIRDARTSLSRPQLNQGGSISPPRRRRVIFFHI